MHLIKTRDNEILNLETGDLYHLEKNLLPENCRVDKNDKLTVSGGADCLRFWAYLESLLKFDATKAQDAPDNFATPKVGDKVYRAAKNNRVIEGKITELAQSDNGFMVTWEGQSIALFETVHSVSWIPF